MPTTKPRHTITETDEIREVLDRAQEALPACRSRNALLRELVRLGGEELHRRRAQDDVRGAERRRRLELLADLSTGVVDGLDPEALASVRREGLATGLA